ncbi:MAG: transposase [Nitrososphaerota archaeon]|jgi:hypothetical protein|nr:transposase [Nitrososphaerota archaeon]
MSRVVAPIYCENSIVGCFFEAWFGNMFVPCVLSGVAVVLDDAGFHRKKCLSVIAERMVGIGLLFLSAYFVILALLSVDGKDESALHDLMSDVKP